MRQLNSMFSGKQQESCLLSVKMTDKTKGLECTLLETIVTGFAQRRTFENWNAKATSIGFWIAILH